MEKQSVFATLSSISVKDKIERKGNLDYLSWANAWAMLKANYPDTQRVVYESPFTGLNYFTDGTTAYVKVGVLVNGWEHIDYLPIMDFRNNAIPIAKITSMDVNKAIQRSTAKAIAMHGLGLSLWTGEDIPEPTTTTPETPAVIDRKDLVKDTEEWERVSAYVNGNKDKKFADLVEQISRKFIIKANVQKELEKIHKAK
tara:strand:+ start:2692 stop:3288 length:597 start_codon:yes stop_codon:yes gene_type:complete